MVTSRGNFINIREYGCDRIITDKITGSKFKRQGLDNLLLQLKEDDTIVVPQLDRLGRSLKELLSTIEMIEKKGCDFVSITQVLDSFLYKDFRETFQVVLIVVIGYIGVVTRNITAIIVKNLLNLLQNITLS